MSFVIEAGGSLVFSNAVNAIGWTVTCITGGDNGLQFINPAGVALDLNDSGISLNGPNAGYQVNGIAIPTTLQLNAATGQIAANVANIAANLATLMALVAALQGGVAVCTGGTPSIVFSAPYTTQSAPVVCVTQIGTTPNGLSACVSMNGAPGAWTGFTLHLSGTFFGAYSWSAQQLQ